MKLTEITIYIACLLISAFATTDILRLLKGTSTPILQPDCFCPVCSNKLKLTEQLPIISYFLQAGRCKHCKAIIPISNLYFELFLSMLLILIAFLSNFSLIGYLISTAAYEAVKFAAIIIAGRRENDFIKNLLLSFLQDIIIFLLFGFLFIINTIA